ncbi:BamA/TamA family outer membrane protein [Neolewinella antarctica]|uniref:Outer membrane protein assembly factor BamA n=1 Tax=Neolewinella antarctica TaxID=442734 RepID=A0ABX0X9Q2_9BACT|nr:BamA/TamA family outer membrane protein [Neolewinella antarctica]NJC25684.1 outer membrane protein assembly factor BamA [Neolewinella antarctica]
MPHRHLLSGLLLTLLPLTLPAQGFIEKLTDLLEFNLGRPPVDTNAFRAKVVLAPIVFYDPNTSVGFGFGASLLFKPKGAGPETRTSNVPLGASYTLNNQIFATSSFTVFFPEEKWLLRGNLGYIDFPHSYYGVGNGSDEEDRSEITYQQFLVEPVLLRQVLPKLFIGGGFRYNHYFNNEIIEEKPGFPAGTSLQDSIGSRSVGLEFASSYDSRDNLINAERGVLAEFTQGFYGTALRGTSVFQISKLDLRTYRRLNERSVFGVQLFARYAAGEAPVQELSTLGGDDLLRGFIEFRFRDRLALFTQAEYRWQTWKNVGVVFFGGFGQVADDVGSLGIDQLRYSVGTGLRVAIIPSENVNLRVDYGVGLGLSRGTGFYIGLGEAF